SLNLGKGGWNRAAAAAASIRAITQSNANGLASHVTGQLGYAADFSKAFKGIDSTLLYSTLAVVIVILLITYRSPVLWLLPVVSAGVALITAPAGVYLLAAHARGGDLPAGRPRGAEGQRERGGLSVCAGVRRQHRLCAADRRRVPGGTAPPRPPPLGDGHRAAARWPGDHRQRRHGHRVLADTARGGVAVDQGPGASAGDRRRRRHARHAHPVAGAAGDLPPRGVLAVPARLRLGRAHHPRAVGAGRLGHRTPAAVGVDHNRRDPGHPGAGADRPEGRWPDQRPVLPRDP